MKRSFIRHRLMYRMRARAHVAFTQFLPYWKDPAAPCWFSFPSPLSKVDRAKRAFQGRLNPGRIEDLQDEMQRRLDKRNTRTANA